MSHPAKKIKVDIEDVIEAKGAPAEAAAAEEHEAGGEEQEHAEEEETYETLDEGLKEELDSAVAALEEVQEKIRGVKEEAIDKILAIEQQANRDCQPIYKDRAELISKIPSFWKFVLLQHWLLERLITQEDQEVLDYLEQVFVEENADVKSGFAVRMQFAENPYFSNSELAKRVDFLEDGSVKLSSNPPQWHPGKDLTQLQAPAGGEGEEGGDPAQPSASFFQWFQVPEDEQPAEDEVAEIIREQIWPNPLQLYMGEAGHNPEDELEVAYPDEEDDLVEYDNEGYAQDLLDEQGFEGEEYPEVGQGFGAEGYPEEFAGVQYDYGEGEVLKRMSAGGEFQDEKVQALEGADDDLDDEEAAAEEGAAAGKTTA